MSAKIDWDGVADWALARLRESGTWAGFAGLLLAADIHVDADEWGPLVNLGVAFFSVVAIVKKDAGSRR